jgi:hypothetical protein
MRDQHNRPLRPDDRINELPQKLAVCREAVGEGARFIELFAIAHADQVRRDTAPERR